MPNDHYPNVCTICGNDAYIGAMTIECSSAACTHYAPLDEDHSVKYVPFLKIPIRTIDENNDFTVNIKPDSQRTADALERIAQELAALVRELKKRGS